MWVLSWAVASYRNLKHLAVFMQFTAARAPRWRTSWGKLTPPSLGCRQLFFFSCFFPLPPPAKLLWSIYSSYCLFASARQEAVPINSSQHFCCVMKKGAWMQTEGKMDSVKTSHNLRCQRNKWGEQEEYPCPTPPRFISHSLLLRGLRGPLLHATVGDQGERNSIYLEFTSYERISYINAAPG